METERASATATTLRSPKTSVLPNAMVSNRSPWLRVPFGQLTFDAEGQENTSRFFSRMIHHPGGHASGVTIGRGYDLGMRTSAEVVSDLTQSGVPKPSATFLAYAAGLTGNDAAQFVQEYRDSAPILSLESQNRLFSAVLLPRYIATLKRVFSKPDVVAKYGEADWDSLSRVTKTVLFDLLFRGDYTGETRELIQPTLVAADEEAFLEVIRDEAYWSSRGVPAGRIAARIAESYRYEEPF